MKSDLQYKVIQDILYKEVPEQFDSDAFNFLYDFIVTFPYPIILNEGVSIDSNEHNSVKWNIDWLVKNRTHFSDTHKKIFSICDCDEQLLERFNKADNCTKLIYFKATWTMVNW